MTGKVSSEYLNFVKNPQGEGLWCLRIEFSERGISTLRNILNLENYSGRAYGLHFRTSVSAYIDEPFIISTLIPRLFSYLRACLNEKLRKSLNPLYSEKDEFAKSRHRRFDSLYRGKYYLNEMSITPSKLSIDKIKKLKKAAKIYQSHFSHFHFRTVPEELNKLDFIDYYEVSFFQVVEEISGQLKFISPSELPLQFLKTIIEAIPDLEYTIKKYKIFSPESSLMEAYLPVLRLVRLEDVVRDRLFNKNLKSAIDEVVEGRYPHSIRAIGIAAEEILVEVFETLIREKAPETPIGNLLNSLNERINKIMHGSKKNELDISSSYKEFGNIITSIKSDPTSHASLPLIIESIQKHVLPLINKIKKDVDAVNVSEKRSVLHPSIFPVNVQNCVDDILNLRNKVSHRVDKRIASPDIGYIEAVIAIKSLLMLGIWWHAEKVKIDYKKNQKDIINELIKRNSSTQDTLVKI